MSLEKNTQISSRTLPKLFPAARTRPRTPLEKFLDTHPAAARYLALPKPTPTSYAIASYYSVSAFALIDKHKKKTFVRFHIIPEAGEHSLDMTTASEKDPDFLQEEIRARLGDDPIKFRLAAQIAENGDVTDDATVPWDESRRVVDLGDINLNALPADNADAQQKIIFHPAPSIEGFEASDDPLFETRRELYLMSGQKRRGSG